MSLHVSSTVCYIYVTLKGVQSPTDMKALYGFLIKGFQYCYHMHSNYKFYSHIIYRTYGYESSWTLLASTCNLSNL